MGFVVGILLGLGKRFMAIGVDAFQVLVDYCRWFGEIFVDGNVGNDVDVAFARVFEVARFDGEAAVAEVFGCRACIAGGVEIEVNTVAFKFVS